MAKRLAGRCGYPASPHEFDVTLHIEKLEAPLRWRKPSRVFVCSMSDLFHPAVPFEFIRNVYNIAAFAPRHNFQILTKRPERALEFYNWLAMGVTSCDYPNVWLGVTAENQEQADTRIPILLQIPAAMHFVSIEPMLGEVDLTNIRQLHRHIDSLTGLAWIQNSGTFSSECNKLDWVICGGETGPGARSLRLEWVRDLRDQCLVASVPFFFKRWGSNPHPDAFINIPYINAQVTLPGHGGFLDGRRWHQYPK